MNEGYIEFSEKIKNAVEILDGYLLYGKEYPQKYVSDAWKVIKEEMFDWPNG